MSKDNKTNAPQQDAPAGAVEQAMSAAAMAEAQIAEHARVIADAAARQVAGMPGNENTGLRHIDTKYKPDFDGNAASRIGGRSENQDTLAYCDTPYGLLVLVCDGMGGGPGGKTASVIAASVITDYIKNLKAHKEPEVVMAESFRLAGFAVSDYAGAHRQFMGMGSTVVALLINRDFAIAGHIGDSRLYQLRGQKTVYRSTDHSMVMNRVKMGQMTEEEARTSGESNIITQALGPVSELNPEIVRLSYQKGDRFVLCSDGIWGVYPNKEMVRMLATPATSAGAVDATVISVDDYGRANGNRHDNLTLAVVDTNISSKLKEPMNKVAKITITALGALLAVSVICNIALGVRTDMHSDADKKNMQASIDSAVNARAAVMQRHIDSLKAENDALKAAQPTMAQQVTEATRQQSAEQQSHADLATRIQKLEEAVANLKNSKDFEESLEKAGKEAESLEKACVGNGEAKAALAKAKELLGQTKQYKTKANDLKRQKEAIQGSLKKARKALNS